MSIDLRERTATSLHALPPRRPALSPSAQPPLVLTLVGLSAVGAALFSNASPAGIALADVLYRSAFAGLIVWFAARSRRSTWPVLAGAAALSTATLLGQTLSIVALLVTANAIRRRRRNPAVGALIAAICVPALLSQGSGPVWRLTGGAIEDPFASSAMITLVATLPIVRSGWRTLSRRKRQAVRRRLRHVVMVAGVITFATIVTLALALPPMIRGLESNRRAMAAATDGDLDAASLEFDAASAEWRRANTALSRPWMVPSRLLPLVGQHVRAAQVITGQASAVSNAASVAAERVRPDELIVDGAINFEEVEAITPAVTALAATTTRATTRIDAVRSPWLIPALGTRVDRAVELLGQAAGVTNASSEALHVGTSLLGREAASKILVMVSTPAEARGTGGFVGNWALLEASEGRVSLTRQYQARELNELLAENAATLHADTDYEARYGRFAVERHIQDVTLSPDFPSVAPVAADLFEQGTGETIDAVLLIDPFVIAKMLEFTGPLDVDSPSQLTAKDAPGFLLVDQYAEYADDERQREAHLLGLTEQLIEAIFESPPNPLAFATELAPLAEQNRVSLWLADDDDGSIVERLGLSGSFPKSGEVLAVVHQNAGQNKIDPYLDRTIDIRSTIDTKNATVDHNVTITLDNTAPNNGLPDAVLASNDQGLDLGTNRAMLSVYSTSTLVAARIDGQIAPVEVSSEFDMWVYSFVITLGAGDFSTIELELSTSMPMNADFDITLGAQPLAKPDQVSWRLSTTDGRVIVPPDGWLRGTDGVRWASQLESVESFHFDLDD